MTDLDELPLVEHLRLLANAHARDSASGTRRALLMAANEIERLRGEIAASKALRDRIYVSSEATPDE